MFVVLWNMVIMEFEIFVEYDEVGFIKGVLKKVVKFKYFEDVYINNYMLVWGSWWLNFKWGFVCCYFVIKNSYCIGEEGKEVWEVVEW